jgi:hypothetical protein
LEQDNELEYIDEEPKIDIDDNGELKKFSVVNDDKSYMISFILKNKETEKGRNLIKTTDKIRTNFLSKLAYQKMWISP